MRSISSSMMDFGIRGVLSFDSVAVVLVAVVRWLLTPGGGAN
jgi:hypothetical protein